MTGDPQEPARTTGPGEGLVVPAWLGPDKLFVLDKAGSYLFGLFALDDRRFAFSDGQVRLSGAWADVEVDWPWNLAGAGLRIRARGKRAVVAFARPFPEAPGPDPSVLDRSAAALDGAAALPLGAAAQLGAGLIGDGLTAVQSLLELRAGRTTCARVRELLEGAATARQ